MHILFLAEDFTEAHAAQGGVRVSLWRQAAGLAARTRVTVLSPRRLYPPLRRYRQTGAPLVPPAAAAWAPAGPLPFCLLRPRILHLPFLWPLAEPLQVLAACAVALLGGAARGADLVHGHRAFPMGLVAVLLGRLCRRPSVVTVYGTEVNVEAEAGSWLLRRLVRAGLRAKRVIAVSRALAERLPQVGVDPERVRQVPSGVDLGLFVAGDGAEARQALGLPADRFIFLAMNLFDPVKGHAVLIEAMARVVRRRPRAFLAMTGEGSERPRIERRAHELGLDGVVRFAGLLAYAELPRWVNAADALVLPSLSEGMPLTILEGFACGKPLIGSRVGGVQELVSDDRYGILAPPGDPEELAAALEAAMDRPWDSAAIRERAQEFAWPRVVERILGVYRELLAR